MGMVSISEAEVQLGLLLDRVAQGEQITITRNGVPAAVLSPVVSPSVKLSHAEVVAGMRELRKRVKPGDMSVRDMIEAGRRY
jgi:prevent-host-death family protein